MRAYEFIIESIVPLPYALKGIHTLDELQKLTKSSDKSVIQEIIEYINMVNYQGYCEKLHTDHPVLLYHGAPEKYTSLQVTNGKRSGFLGADKIVKNKGIFLSSDKSVAMFFGNNRSKNGNDAVLYKVYANLNKVLDMRDIKNIPSELHKVGLHIINTYYGTRKQRLAKMDIWQLMDTSFVDSIKEYGYNAVHFYESPSVQNAIKKEYHTNTLDTYLVFSPNDIIIINKENDILKTLDDLIEYINKR